MSKHQKRLSAPKRYPIRRKNGTYVSSSEGPHAAEEGLPLTVVLRDLMGYAENQKEVKQLLQEEKVLIDGNVQRNPRRNVGFMDVISFPTVDEHYRVLLTRTGFALKEIDADEAARKVVRIQDKTTLKGGKTQLNLSDGNNIETDDAYDTRGSIIVSVPEMTVEKELPFTEGSTAVITGGKHAGEVAQISEIEIVRSAHPNRVTLEREDGDAFTTVEQYVYVVGEDEPEVDLDDAGDA